MSMGDLDPATWPVVRLAGDIDMASITRTTLIVRRSIRSFDAGVVLDLVGVTFFGSEAVHLIITLLRDELRVRVINPTPMVTRVIAMVGLEVMPGFELQRPD
jgi:anti-anti-sigma factor